MKKILIIILAGVLLHPLPTKAQFGQDAAALIGFLTPYLGALEALSEASGMEISDLKKITQQSIQLTSSLAKVYNAGNRLYRVSSRTHEIYIEYLETIKYIYDNSIYFEDEEASYHVAVLNKVVFGQADQDGKLSVNNIMDGAMGDLKDLLNSMQSGAQTTLTEMARYLDDVRKQMDDTYGIICSYHTYLICSVNRKQHELGMYELDEYLTNRKNEPNTHFWSREYNQFVHYTVRNLLQFKLFNAPLLRSRQLLWRPRSGINVLPYSKRSIIRSQRKNRKRFTS